MITKENVINEINNFKQLLLEIDSHIDDRNFFMQLSNHAEYIAHDIDRIHSGYYVAFAEYGPDDNFIREYYPLGLMTAEQAYKILNEELIGNEDDLEPWNDSGIKEVTKDELNKYYELIKLQKLYDSLHDSQYNLRDILPSDFIDNLKNKVDALRNELGFTRRWMHVCSRF